MPVASIGNWLGGLTSYWLGRAGKWEWLERYCKVKRETIEKHQHNVARYGSLLAFFTWLPFIGDVMAIALGFYRIDWRKINRFHAHRQELTLRHVGRTLLLDRTGFRLTEAFVVKNGRFE